MSTVIWTFKYEPKTLAEMILSPSNREKLQKTIDELPNLMIYGQPGTGKGTFMNIFLHETKADFLRINASDETSIDTMREKVKPFAYGGSLAIKYVILNESEALSSGKSGAQKMLKDLMEMVQKRTRFYYMTNEIYNMDPALRSRCTELCLDDPPLKDIVLHTGRILKNENVKYDPKILIEFCKECYPDVRKTIMTLQENSINGILKEAVVTTTEEIYQQIIVKMIDKDVDEVRGLIKNNPVNYPRLYEYLFNEAGGFKSPGAAILSIGDHLRYNETTCNSEINFMHMMFEMIFKEII